MTNERDRIAVRPVRALVPSSTGKASVWLRGLKVALFLFVFLLGVKALGDGFKLLGKEALDQVFAATKNPFVGLAIGILSTSLVQSSSVTTSMIVALVAAPENPLPVAHAIPMVMGANIGTSVTNTMVSVGHVARPDEFRRAVAAGTCDDFYNLVAVIVLFPLELATGFLHRLSGLLVKALPRPDEATLPNPVAAATDAVLEPVISLALDLAPSEAVGGVAVLVLAAGLLFSSLLLLVRELRKFAGSRVQSTLRRALGKTAWVGFFAGAVLTAIVQSSSLTLSVLVPFAATKIVTLEELFPIVLGANFGTTFTALVASTAPPPETIRFAVQIALVHLLFNIIGTSLIYPIERLRRIPLNLSRWVANTAVQSKSRALLYVVALFYGLPGAGFVLWHLFKGGMS